MSKKFIYAKGNKLFTNDGLEFIAKGINMVCKDKSRNYIGNYKAEDFRFLKEHGFNLIRLGLAWDGAEPEPGKYDEKYFEKIDNLIALAREAGILVFLDMHQDLYGVVFEDGAPEWATITDDEQHIRTELWSESYLISPAVQHAFDNFWKNSPASDGVGIRTHYIELLKFVTNRYAENPYVIGFDIMNEPFPGTPGAAVGEIMGRFLQTSEGGESDVSAFNNPESITAIVSEIFPITSKFESEVLNPFYDEAARAIRSVDKDILFMFEANYFANAGIPSVLRPAVYEDGRIIENQVFAPHGYDILVDTEAYDEGGLERVGFIFSSILNTATKMGIPVMIGEWGCYPNASEAQKEQAKFLLKMFTENCVGNVYFDYSHLHDGKIIQVLF